MDKGKGKAVVTPTRPQKTHGKDAKLLALVREADNGSSSKERESTFEAKKIGKKAVFRPILSSPFNARWWVAMTHHTAVERKADFTPFASGLL